MDFDAKAYDIIAKEPEGRFVVAGTFQISGREMLAYGGPALIERLRVGVEMRHYKPEDRVVVREEPAAVWTSWEGASEFDGLAAVPFEERPMGSLPLFSAMGVGKEIYLPPASVDECLDRILQLQYPKQEELKNAKVVAPKMAARIYSLAA